MDHKYKEEPDEVHTNVVSESTVAHAKKFLGDGFKLPDDVKVLPDKECEEGVDVVIASRMGPESITRMTMAGIPWGAGRCHNCGHAVIISDASPKQPAKLCVECAIKEGRVPSEWAERLKKNQ